MSRAGFGPDYIHMNASGTQVMADSFSYYVKKDQGQTMPYPAHPVFWNGNYTDRTLEIGSLTPGIGVSFMAGGMNVFDVTGTGGIALIGHKEAELSNAPNIAFPIFPSFWNTGGFTGVTTYDLGLNTESQWINAAGQKVAFFNQGGTIMNIGFGIDNFSDLQPGQVVYYFNTGLGTHTFQGATPGDFNTMVGSFSSDVHTSSQNVIINSGMALGTIGGQNTYAGANGSIASGTAQSASFGFGNQIGASSVITVGTANVLTGPATIAIGSNRVDGGVSGILLGSVPSETYGTFPLNNGDAVIGGIYTGGGFYATRNVYIGGTEALNSGISGSFSTTTLTVAGILAGNTNLSARANEFDIAGAVSTGNALSGDVVISTSQQTTSGTARQSLVKMLRVGADQTVDIGEPATHPYGTNINTSVGINKDSAALIAPVSTTYALVLDATSQKVNRIALGGILAKNDLTAQSGAVGTVTSYAVPGSGGFNTFRVGGYLTVTAVSLDVIQLQVTYTDETSTSRTQSFFVQGATTGISATGANGYSPMDIRVKQGTTITVATVLTTGTGTITYDAGSSITQLY